MNDVLKYLIAKCMVKDAKHEATEFLERFKLGVGGCRGLEAIIHTAKITFEKIFCFESPLEILQIDFQSAFNSVNR